MDNYFRDILADLLGDILTPVNNVLAVLPRDLLALLGGDIVPHLLADTSLTILPGHRVAHLLVSGKTMT